LLLLLSVVIVFPGSPERPRAADCVMSELARGSSEVKEEDAEAATIHAQACALLAEGKCDLALRKADDAIALFRKANNKLAISQVMHTKVKLYLQDKRKPEARGVAQEAVALSSGRSMTWWERLLRSFSWRRSAR